MDKLTYHITRLLSIYSTRIVAAILVLSISTIGIYNMISEDSVLLAADTDISAKINMNRLGLFAKNQLKNFLGVHTSDRVFATTPYYTSCNGTWDFVNGTYNAWTNQCYIDCRYGGVGHVSGQPLDNPDQFCIGDQCRRAGTSISGGPWGGPIYSSSADFDFSFGPNPAGISMSVATSPGTDTFGNVYTNDIREAYVNVTCNDAPPAGSCIGSIPSNAGLCGNSSTNPASDTNYTLGSCDGTDCRYSCNAGYHDNGAGGCDPDCASNNGQSCSKTSAANSCGQTNTTYGTYQCDGSCNAAEPSIPDSSSCTPQCCSYTVVCAATNVVGPNGADLGVSSVTINSNNSYPGSCSQPGGYSCTNNTESPVWFGPGAGSCTNSCSTQGNSCASAPNSCGQTNNGTIQSDCTCNATTPSNPGNLGQSCSKTSNQNACGQSNTTYGTYQCDGSCNAPDPSIPSNPANYGNSCNSNPNSCGTTNVGNIDCNGNCNATTPANPSNLGQSCNSNPNSCGQTNIGTYQCDGSCNATTPSNPGNLGQSCSKTSNQNACGATNTTYGTYQCDGSCNAPDPSIPSNPANYGNSCNSNPNSCGTTNAGTINCAGACTAAAPADPSNLGQACSKISAANSCGMTNTTNGTYQCDGSCSASTPPTPSNSLCPVNATCGTANGVSTYSTPASNLCGAGDGINGTVSLAGNTYSWTCNGSNSGNPINCSAPQRVDCVGSRGGCSQSCGGGTQTYTITTTAANGGNACSSTNGATQSCNTQACAGDGVCGTSSGLYLVSSPTNNLCAVGNASMVLPINNMYIWSCAGVAGGQTADCIAYTDPVCGTTAGTCVGGLADTDNFASCGTRTWNCTNETKTVSCTKDLGACCAANVGASCTSTANSCGATNTGTINCAGACTATTPANPATLGNNCTKISTANACGMTNTTTGTIACDDSCNAATPTVPSNSLCTFSCLGSISANNVACSNNQTPTSDTNYSVSSDSCATAGQCKYRPQTCTELGNCPVNAVCGTASGVATYTSPASNLCGAGSGLTGSVSLAANSYSWTCDGLSGGGAISCSAPQRVDCVGSRGACSLQCGGGTQTYSITTAAANGGVACASTNGATQACNTQACAANGSCGSASGTVAGSIPTSNLCAGGSAGAVMIIGNNYSWTCAGSAGGDSPLCIAYMSPACDTVNAGACTVGTAGNDNNPSCGTRTWTCDNAGQSVNCTKVLAACTYNCLGSVPANSTLCAAADQGLTGNINRLLVGACTLNILPGNANKCEYSCNNGYYYDSLTQSCLPNIVNNNSINGKVYISGTATPIPNVSTYLYDGVTVMSGMSGASNGTYLFTGLANGNYSIGIRLPDGYDGLKNSILLTLVGNSHVSYDFPLWHCGSNNEVPCTDNNCANPICVNGCDAGLVVVGGICVSPAGQLIITKTSVSSGTVGSDIYYKLSIQNNKNIPLTNVVVLDTLPSTLTYVSSQPNATVNGSTVYRNGITLAPGATADYFIHATINATTTSNVINIGYVGTGTTPTDFTTGGSSTVTTPVIFQNNIHGLVYISGTATPITGVLVSLYSGSQNISGYTSNNTGYLFTGLLNGGYNVSITIPAGYTGVYISNIIGLTSNTSANFDFPLTACGGSSQIACDINNCKLPPCNLGCDNGLILSGGICVPPVISNYITGNVYISGTNTVITGFTISLSGISISTNALVGYVFGPLNNGIYTLSTNKSGYNVSGPISSSLTGGMTGYTRFDVVKCGGLEEISCTNNNCQNPVCLNGCDAGLVNINGICKKPSDPITPGGSMPHLYCRDAKEVYLYDNQLKTTDIAGTCPTPNTEYINICRNGQNIKAIKDFNYLKTFVQPGDTMGLCIAKVEVVDIKKYLDITHESAPVVLETKTILPSTGVGSESLESIRK